jgi:class 3 adenylate cyclase
MPGRKAGSRTRRFRDFLKRREKEPPARRPQLDAEAAPALFRRRAVVFTDTADFTLRAARDGIVHFLMVFHRAADALEPVVRKAGGDLVKIEGDSLFLRFDDADAACHGVAAIEEALQKLNEGRPEDERLYFSYGIGYGDVLDLDHDMYGLEVNLASKVGEDLAEPGEALLTPSAAAALSPDLLRRVVPYRVVTFGSRSVPVQRLKLRGSLRRSPVRRNPKR